MWLTLPRIGIISSIQSTWAWRDFCPAKILAIQYVYIQCTHAPGTFNVTINNCSFFVIIGSSSGTESDASSDGPPPSKRHRQGTMKCATRGY